MLIFNNSGLLVPANKIVSTWAELELEFATTIPSSTRKEVVENYFKYSEDLKKVCDLDTLRQWVDGSFVTKKVNPGDIDFISFIDRAIINQFGSKLDDFKYPNAEKKYGVDAYIVEEFPEGHPKRAVFVHDMAYWINLFTKTRRIHGNRLSKGFLEVSF